MEIIFKSSYSAAALYVFPECADTNKEVLRVSLRVCEVPRKKEIEA